MRIPTFYTVLFIALVLSISEDSFCQEWIKTFSSTTKHLFIYEIQEDYDQGYLLCANKGITTNMKIGWLIKTDINGNVLWEKSLGNGSRKWAIVGMDITQDGGIVLAGVSDTLDPSSWDPFIVKLNACGELQWCHVFNNVDDPDYGITIRSLPDDGYVFLLKDWGSEELNSVWLMHLDMNGEIIWEQEYFQNDTLVVPYSDKDLLITPEGKYLVTGVCYRPDSGQVQPYWLWPMMILADSTGDAVWEIPWGYTLPFTDRVGGEGFQSVKTENAYYSCISHYHWPNVHYSPGLIKTSLIGEPVSYQDLIPNTTYGKATTITKISDSVLFIGAGYVLDTISFLSVLKTDTLGTVLAEKVLNHSDFIPKDAMLTLDNKYLITAPDIVNNKYIFYLWKLNQNLGYDSIYTAPHLYDSLCPYPVTTSTLFFQCDLAVGMEEPVKNTDKVRMHIFPNPGHESIHVDLPECIQKQFETEHLTVTTIFHKWYKELEFEVFDLFGKLIFKQNVKPSERDILIDVSGWNRGIYCFRLSYGGMAVATEKVIVN